MLPSCRNCIRYGSSCSFLESQPSGSWSPLENAPSLDVPQQPDVAWATFNTDAAISTETYAITVTKASGIPFSRKRLSCSPASLTIVGDALKAPISNLASKFPEVNFAVRPLNGLLATFYDEGLINHYLTATHLSISNKSSVQEAYRTTILKEALSHEHLMHAILGFTAAHLMHTQPDRQHVHESRARRHQHLCESPTSLFEAAY